MHVCFLYVVIFIYVFCTINIKFSLKKTPKTPKKLLCQQTEKINQQPENWENNNGPDLVQAFPKKWWVESDCTASNLPLPLRLKGSGCHSNIIFNNAGTKWV